MKDDPNVFEYDSLYDDMQEQKKKLDPRLAKKDRSVSQLVCEVCVNVILSLSPNT